MANQKFELNRAGIGALLKSSGMRAAIESRAEAMASRARAMTDDPIEVTVHQRKDRVGAYVTRLGSGARGEAHDRALGRSIGGS